MSEDHFVRVLVPLRLAWIPVYRSAETMERGQAVNVVLSGRRYTGIVWETDAVPDIDESRIRPISSVAAEVPGVRAAEMDFWNFLASYYMCSVGEVYKAARPVFYARRARSSAAAVEKLKRRLSATEAELGKSHRSEAVVRRLEERRRMLCARISESDDGGFVPGPFLPAGGGAMSRPLAVIGSDRLQAYSGAIRKALARNGQVLVLTPESPFSKRLETALRPIFGEAVRRFGPDTSEAGKSRLAEDLRKGRSIVAVGTKTALFLPFSRLALVIIDEEQDPLFKQNDSAPRYNGRDAAIKLAELHSAEVMLGSSCPSLETAYNCRTGKYAVSECPGRLGRAEVIDMAAEKRKNGISGHFSRRLVSMIRECGGPVTIIRGWEKSDEIASETEVLFPDMSLDVITLNELKRDGCGTPAMIAVLQADALVSKDDFRSDERAMQIVTMLRSLSPEVKIQTSVPERFDGSKTEASLLDERKKFGFPPYTRLVDIKTEGSAETVERHFLKRDRTLASCKARILAAIPPGCYPDVDPA